MCALPKIPAAARPEIELLWRCGQARAGVVGSQRRIEELAQQDLDWQYVREQAVRQGVLPLVYERLQTTCADVVPHSALEAFQRYSKLNTLRNQFLAVQLGRLLGALAEHDIIAVPYKGPAMAAGVYGDLALRQAGDLDILIRKPDLEQARQLAAELGYRPRKDKTARQEAETLKHGYEYHLVRDEGQVFVGLHWRVTADMLNFDFDALDVWQRLHSSSLDGSQIRTLAAEDLLLLLCVHGTKDLWVRFIWICDLAELIGQTPHFGWAAMLERAERSGCERMLLLGLGLCHHLLETPLPPQVLASIEQDPMVPALVAELSEGMLAEEASPDYETRLHLYLRVREHLRDRWVVYRALIYEYDWMTPSHIDRAFWPMSPGGRALCWCCWPLRFIGKLGVEPIRALKQQFKRRSPGPVRPAP